MDKMYNVDTNELNEKGFLCLHFTAHRIQKKKHQWPRYGHRYDIYDVRK